MSDNVRLFNVKLLGTFRIAGFLDFVCRPDDGQSPETQ
jgi:hypothetical protein